MSDSDEKHMRILTGHGIHRRYAVELMTASDEAIAAAVELAERNIRTSERPFPAGLAALRAEIEWRNRDDESSVRSVSKRS